MIDHPRPPSETRIIETIRTLQVAERNGQTKRNSMDGMTADIDQGQEIASRNAATEAAQSKRRVGDIGMGIENGADEIGGIESGARVKRGIGREGVCLISA